jgi:uncharacterized phage-like protein YoqJ
MILAGTGHRPGKLFGTSEAAYTSANQASLQAFARRILEATPNISVVRSGMALGWDQALAAAAHDLGIPWHAYVPFAGQASRWPAAARARYDTLLATAASTTIVIPGHPDTSHAVRSAMMTRNAMLVDGAGIVVALWDGQPSGTADAIAKARAQGILVRNYWPKWVAWRAELLKSGVPHGKP